MDIVTKLIGLIVIVFSFSACKSYVSDEDLQNISARIELPIKIVISGLPPQNEARDLILSFDDNGNITYSAAVAVGFGSSSGGGYYYPRIPMSSNVGDAQYDRYGSQEQVAIPIIYNIEDWCNRDDSQYLKEYRLPNEDEIIVSVDVLSSSIISKIPSSTFGISIGGVKEHTGASVGATWAKRDRCTANIVAEFQFMIDGKQSEKFKASIEGQQIKVKDQDAASNVYVYATKRLAREIVYKLLELKDDGFFGEE